MNNAKANSNQPLVTVLISTYNRPRYLAEALESIFRQTYPNFEVILTRDGGADVKHVVQKFDDPRLIFIDRDENKGLPYSFNRAIEMCRGEYITYLGDDDIFYPHHIETLVDAMLNSDERYGLVYSDLYKAHCRVEEDGSRTVLAKNLEVSRDFDRMVMLQFNHTLHVSILHRKDLFVKAGLYNENINILVDWDMTRKLCHYTDFLHVRKITGEFYAPVGDCDRISVVGRKSETNYIKNVLTIRGARPPKPWPCMHDLSVIILTQGVNQRLIHFLSDLWTHSFYPCQFYVPLTQSDIPNLRTIVPNVLAVPVEPGASDTQKIDAVLECCQGDYISVVPDSFPLDSEDIMWVEKSLNAIINESDPSAAYLVEGSNDYCWSAVFSKAQLQRARRIGKSQDFAMSLNTAGLKMIFPTFYQYPMLFDHYYGTACEYEQNKRWADAAQVFEQMYEKYDNEYWMKTRGANALYHAQYYDTAANIAAEINQRRPTVSSLLIEARSRKKMDQTQEAVGLYTKAQRILEEREFAWTQ